jgi:hypothetical protein
VSEWVSMCMCMCMCVWKRMNENYLWQNEKKHYFFLSSHIYFLFIALFDFAL